MLTLDYKNERRSLPVQAKGRSHKKPFLIGAFQASGC